MGIVAFLLWFLIAAFNAACNKDYSGVEMMFNGLIYLLFMAAAIFIIVNPVIVVMIGIFLLFIFLSIDVQSFKSMVQYSNLLF